jgi:hypothetical protein
VKRVDFIRHLEANGCRLLRDGANHAVYVKSNAPEGVYGGAPPEVKEYLARKICRDLEIAMP